MRVAADFVNLLSYCGICVIAFISGLDRAFVSFITKRLNKPSDLDTTRWFFIHAICNFFVCVTAFPALVAVFQDPLHALDPAVFHDASVLGNASLWPLTIINSVHIYHMIGNFK